MRPNPALLLSAALLAAPAWADTTTYSLVPGGDASSSALDTLKGVAITASDDTLIDVYSPYFTTSGATVRFGIWESTGTSSWSLLWDESNYISSAGYTDSYPYVLLDAGQTYFFGYWLDATMGYHWSSAAQPDPAWGQLEGRITYSVTTFPTTFTRSYDSTSGGYRMEITATTVTDADLDGWESDEDCDDSDPDTHPTAPELCDGVDNDCNGLLPADEQDGDLDGAPPCEGDCDDSDASTWPGAPEQCDGADNDCDGGTDENLTADADGDGFTSSTSCEGSSDDCNDGDDTIHPGAIEVCDFVDNDCDGDVDEGFGWDDDGDLYTDADCGGDDCDDERAESHPGAPELCDGFDNDCDGAAPDDELVDDDGDGETACTDCDDEDPAVHTGQSEDCGNGIDDNCNGEIDEAGDADGDGYGACDDCDDADPAVHPGADEDECNGVDDDCDGDLHPLEEDDDGNGFMGCEGDCDDDNELVYPDAEEVCDGFDNDCDGDLHPDEGPENDGDGDGAPLCFDCDDADPDVHPGADEDPCGDIDADCDGEIPDGSDCGDDGGGGGGGGRRSSGCGCSTAEGAAGLPLLLLLFVRRRRGGPR
jgi:MYXO-CTERM domain-containing protein